MEWLLLLKHSFHYVADYINDCPANESTTRKSSDKQLQKRKRLLIGCLGNPAIPNCIQNALDKADADAEIVFHIFEDVPSPSKEHMDLLTNDARVAKIYATNPAPQKHPKLEPFPIGVSSLGLWHSLLDGREARTEHRTKLLECGGITMWLGGGVVIKGAKLSVSGNPAGLRKDKQRMLKANGFVCGGKMKKEQYIESLLTSKFVFSPRGHGQQNYREWEALTAGSIPLIDTPPPTHVALYDKLPIVFVDDWSKITKEYLEDKWDEIQQRARNGEYDMNRAQFYPYWLYKLLGA